MKTSIFQQHYDHTEWLSKLSFYADEIVILKKRLEEVVKNNNSKEFLAEVEHFQNQLILQKESLDILKHNVNAGEKEVVDGINKNPVASDHRKTEVHGNEKEQIESFEKDFKGLREDFDKFLAKYM